MTGAEILLIEDEATSRVILETVLTGAGYCVDIAAPVSAAPFPPPGDPLRSGDCRLFIAGWGRYFPRRSGRRTRFSDARRHWPSLGFTRRHGKSASHPD